MLELMQSFSILALCLLLITLESRIRKIDNKHLGKLTSLERLVCEIIPSDMNKIRDKIHQLEGHLEIGDGKTIKLYYGGDITTSRLTKNESQLKELKECITKTLEHLNLEYVRKVETNVLKKKGKNNEH